MADSKQAIISLGGSLLVPGDIDTDFLSAFSKLIKTYVAQGWKFVIIVGGGKLARAYQQALTRIDPESNVVTKDWIGIYATRLNAELVRMSFGDLASARIVTDPSQPVTLEKPVLIGAGWKPGFSTDYDAVLLATQLHFETIINLTNTPYVYDRDPKEHPDARPLTDIDWETFRALLPETWVPGSNTPFDPIAAKAAHEAGLRLISLHGQKLDRLQAVLDGGSIEGTVIS